MGGDQVLAGLRVLLPQRRSPRLAEAIRAAGAEVIEVALTDVEFLGAPGLWRDDLAAGRFDWVVFASATAVDFVAPTSAPVATVGPRTTDRAAAAGWPVALTAPPPHGAAALLSVWPDGAGRVLLPGSADADPLLADGLRERGWEVETVATYRLRPVANVPDQLRARWRDAGFDAVVLTSGSVAAAARQLLGPGGPPAVVLGEQSAARVRELGFVALVSEAAAADAVVRTLRRLKEDEPWT